MIITNSRYALVGYFITSYPTRAHGIIVKYPTSASGIIVLLITPPKYRKLDYNKNEKAQKITHTLAIFVDHGIMAHTMMVKPIKTLELHYPMIQFLIISNYHAKSRGISSDT